LSVLYIPVTITFFVHTTLKKVLELVSFGLQSRLMNTLSIASRPADGETEDITLWMFALRLSSIRGILLQILCLVCPKTKISLVHVLKEATIHCMLSYNKHSVIDAQKCRQY